MMKSINTISKFLGMVIIAIGLLYQPLSAQTCIPNITTNTPPNGPWVQLTVYNWSQGTFTLQVGSASYSIVGSGTRNTQPYYILANPHTPFQVKASDNIAASDIIYPAGTYYHVAISLDPSGLMYDITAY